MLLLILLYIIILSSIGFGKIFHGVGMQMANNGTGLYYKSGWILNYNTQIIADIGFHLNSASQTSTYDGYSKQIKFELLEISGGFRRELLKESIAGSFRPVLIFQGGSAVKLNNIFWNNKANWMFIYVASTGFQFYNDSILNEILLKFNQILSKERNISFQLSIYWK